MRDIKVHKQTYRVEFHLVSGRFLQCSVCSVFERHRYRAAPFSVQAYGYVYERKQRIGTIELETPGPKWERHFGISELGGAWNRYRRRNFVGGVDDIDGDDDSDNIGPAQSLVDCIAIYANIPMDERNGGRRRWGIAFTHRYMQRETNEAYVEKSISFGRLWVGTLHTVNTYVVYTICVLSSYLSVCRLHTCWHMYGRTFGISNEIKTISWVLWCFFVCGVYRLRNDNNMQAITCVLFFCRRNVVRSVLNLLGFTSADGNSV